MKGNNKKGLIFSGWFILGLVLYTGISYLLYNWREDIVERVNATFEGIWKIYAFGFMVNVFTAAVIFISIWLIKKIVQSNIKLGLIPICIMVVMHLIRVYTAFAGGIFISWWVDERSMPNYIVMTTIIMCFAIGYTLVELKRRKAEDFSFSRRK